MPESPPRPWPRNRVLCVASVRSATVALLLAIAAASPAFAEDDWIVSRRKDPFPTTESYMVLPLPYSIPGVGSGLGAVLYETNHLFLHRAYLVAIGGDVEGTFVSLEQVHLVERRLLIDLFGASLAKYQARSYTFRGMDTDDGRYTLLDYNKYEYYAPQLTYTQWERRFELYAQAAQGGARLTKVRDSSGHVISTFTEPQTSYFVQYRGGVRIDLTDEYYDPRSGVRFVTEYNDSPRQVPSQPDFYTIDYRLTGYVPLGLRSTLGLHAFQSDAVVRQTGETRTAVLNRIDDLGCAPADATCMATQTALVNNDLAANRNGTSTQLGGDVYLRGYPAGRFKGAHTLYVSAELRINLTDEVTPFDYVFFRDVRTGIQVAPFYEAGSVAETVGSLGSRWKEDAGIGFRLVTASGSVYRVDIASGSEGTVPSLTVFYPW